MSPLKWKSQTYAEFLKYYQQKPVWKHDSAFDIEYFMKSFFICSGSSSTRLKMPYGVFQSKGSTKLTPHKIWEHYAHVNRIRQPSDY